MFSHLLIVLLLATPNSFATNSRVDHVAKMQMCALMVDSEEATQKLTAEVYNLDRENLFDTVGYIGLTRHEGEELVKTGRYKPFDYISVRDDRGPEVVLLSNEMDPIKGKALARKNAEWRAAQIEIHQRLRTMHGVDPEFFNYLPAILDHVLSRMAVNPETGRNEVSLANILGAFYLEELNLPINPDEITFELDFYTEYNKSKRTYLMRLLGFDGTDAKRSSDPNSKRLLELFSGFEVNTGYVFGVQQLRFGIKDQSDQTQEYDDFVTHLVGGLNLTDITGIFPMGEGQFRFMNKYAPPRNYD